MHQKGDIVDVEYYLAQKSVPSNQTLTVRSEIVDIHPVAQDADGQTAYAYFVSPTEPAPTGQEYWCTKSWGTYVLKT
jgi:hypothetical protein